MAEAQVAAAGGGNGGQEEGGGMMRMMMQFAMLSMAMNFFTRSMQPQPPPGNTTVPIAGEDSKQGIASRAPQVQMNNLFSQMEECELLVHWSLQDRAPSLKVAVNQTLAEEGGWKPLWRTRVWYEANALPSSINVSFGPFPQDVLSGNVEPYIHALLVRTVALEENIEEIAPWQVIQQSLPMVVKLRQLDAQAGAENLFSEQVPTPVQNSSAKVPYFKTKLEIRPVFDQMVHTLQTVQQGPFKKLKLHPKQGFYEPFLYISDFWMLEKDYLPLNDTLAAENVNLSLSYSVITMWSWSIQSQMAEQWMTQGEWGLTDTQRDSFMLKRLYLDTNPYLLAFSGAFIMLHTVFSMLAFKNDVQFWRNNESMKGLSARSMCVSFVCQLITALYLLDSQETSRLILFEILLDTSLAVWKLRKAVKFETKKSFPFVKVQGQKGYEEKGTNKYDEDALRYMGALLTPLFIGYSIRSALYGKHRGWYSFCVNAAAGGVYTFGFVMMTPQLYINYKLQSVEHLPWRALSYKAMNTFVDDIAAFLIDMPLMHRLSCFRDDIVFFIYIFQRWKYRVDKERPSMWVAAEEVAPALSPVEGSEDGQGDLAAASTTSEAPPAGDDGIRQRR